MDPENMRKDEGYYLFKTRFWLRWALENGRWIEAAMEIAFCITNGRRSRRHLDLYQKRWAESQWVLAVRYAEARAKGGGVEEDWKLEAEDAWRTYYGKAFEDDDEWDVILFDECLDRSEAAYRTSHRSTCQANLRKRCEVACS